MYIFHAWIELWPSIDEEDAQDIWEEKLQILEDLARDKLKLFGQNPIVYINYITTFQCFSSHNHLTDAHERLIHVLNWIRTELPGSYGVVYWMDDEAESWKSFSGYNVIVMKKGALFHEIDRFLSPQTEIEDFED